VVFVVDIDIPIALTIIFISALCGLVGQLIRISIGLFDDYLKAEKHRDDELEVSLRKRLDDIELELVNTKDRIVEARLRSEKMRINNLVREHKFLYTMWLDKNRLWISLVIPVFIGALAGILYPVSGLAGSADVNSAFAPLLQLSLPHVTSSFLVSLLPIVVSGYVGTDVIEAFMKKNKITIPTSMKKEDKGA
jgi:hypothetical protein